MAIAITKTLKKATPTVRTADQVVKKWDLEIIYSHTPESGQTFSRTYSVRGEDVEYLEKTVDQFTRAELIALSSDNMDAVFESHFITATAPPPQEEKVESFNLNSLGG